MDQRVLFIWNLYMNMVVLGECLRFIFKRICGLINPLVGHLDRDLKTQKIMKSIEKQITYETRNSYSTLNQLTHKTKNVWVVLHGIGFLSRFFLKFFDGLNADENYIIAPQAPSKYYLNNEYRHVGASWLTKENTALETENVISYLDALLANEDVSPHHNLIIFGFSQGVSIAMRWVANSQLKCSQLILYAGGIPNELTKENLKFLKVNETQITSIIGNKDEFLTEERLKIESEKIDRLFYGRAKRLIFDGGHEIKPELVLGLI